MVKLAPSLVKLLKDMNMVYPNTSSDFDLIFLRHLLPAVFEKDELKNCAFRKNLRQLNAEKLRFAKGNKNHIYPFKDLFSYYPSFQELTCF